MVQRVETLLAGRVGLLLEGDLLDLELQDAPLDAETKAKLAEVYTQIYCAQRRGESEKLLEIYTTNGFPDPEAWTKVWTKVSKDGAWVSGVPRALIMRRFC